MAKKTIKKDEFSVVDFNEVRRKVKEKLIEKYGSIAAFLHSDKGEEMGSQKIKVYLYEVGPVNFKVTSELCSYLGLGELVRQIEVKREYIYKISKKP